MGDIVWEAETGCLFKYRVLDAAEALTVTLTIAAAAAMIADACE
jgi:hypothetical protein